MALTELAGTPVRVFSTPLPATGRRLRHPGRRRPDGRAADPRHARRRSCWSAGWRSSLASLALGWVYADRALVPIRDAMRRQREFAADASHELRTPLAVVRGSVEDLRRNASSPVSEVGDALDDIETEVDRMRALVDDLLLLARTDSGVIELALEPTDLAAIALDAADGLQPAAERAGVRLEVDAGPGPDVRATRPGCASSSRSSSTTPCGTPRPARRSGSRSRPRPASGRIRVDDDGPGFRPEDLPHVFDRFWRAPDAPTGGTGLGLSIAAWIAERHGGTIVAANRPSGGARLEVVLPIRCRRPRFATPAGFITPSASPRTTGSSTTRSVETTRCSSPASAPARPASCS